MSENESVGKEARLDEVEAEQEDTESQEESQGDSTDWESEAKKWERMAKQNKKKLENLSKELADEPEEKKSEAPKQNKEGLDYGQKAFLQSHELGIKSSEFEFVEKALEKSGMNLDNLLDNGYFVSELKEYRETQATKDATPKGSKRTGLPSKDSIDYYLKKGEIPEDKQLRKEYLKRKLQQDEGKSQFAPLS